MLDRVSEKKLGAVTIAASLTYMFLGLPAQIWKIWLTKSAGDIALPMFGLLVVQSVFWILYGIRKKDVFIVIPNIFGCLFGAIIIAQYYMYR